MNDIPAQPISAPPRLRLWPGVVIVALQWAVVTAIGKIYEGTMIQFMAMFIGPMVAGLGVLIWWLFFSRVGWLDRLVIPLVFVLPAGWVLLVGHESIGMFGIALRSPRRCLRRLACRTRAQPIRRGSADPPPPIWTYLMRQYGRR